MKQLSKHMPFCPIPIHGELFKGYIIRLASRNGRDELKDFVSAFDIKVLAKTIFVVGTPKYDEFLHVLSASIGIDCSMLAPYFEQEKDIQMLAWLSTKHVMVSQPNVCPSCIAKQGFLKADWHLYYATHCHVHESKLWKSCPQCGKGFTWNGKLLSGCTYCNLKWKDVSPIKARLPSSQEALANTHGLAKQDLIKKILFNLKLSLRPFDASIQKLRDIDKYVPDIETHVEHAFQLAHSKAVINDLKKARKQYWQSKIGGHPQVSLFEKVDAVNDAIFDELAAKSSYRIGKPVKVEQASYMLLTPHRRLNTEPDKASLELSWYQLEEILKMGEPHIKSLIKQRIMPGRMHANSSGKVSPSRIDDVVRFFRDIKKRALPLVASNESDVNKSLIAWGDDKSLSKYKLNTKELAKYVSTGEIPIFGPVHHDHLFEDFHFCTSSLDNRFSKKSANSPSQQNIDKNSA